MPGAGPQCGGAEGVIAMRRAGVIVALSALLSLFGGAVTAAPALADGRGDGWQFLPAEPFTLDASSCGFEVLVAAPINKEYIKILKTTDGSMIFLVTGAFTISYTNLDTGKTITRNLSGPSKATALPDGSLTVKFEGGSGIFLTPADAQRFGLPTVSVTEGELTLSIAPDGSFTSLSLHGHVLLDVCAALS
jgi:hypothetical protein